jgi:hypothetical protein
MIIVLSFAVLLAPLIFAFLITSSLSLRSKIIIGTICLALLIFLPLFGFWLGLG